MCKVYTGYCGTREIEQTMLYLPLVVSVYLVNTKICFSITALQTAVNGVRDTLRGHQKKESETLSLVSEEYVKEISSSL